jgi:uncharacterized OsmC-like protein
MKVSATLNNKHNEHHVTVTTDGNSKTISIPSKPSGYGSSVNGAELLLLSLATCYCNDIYREAAKRNITVTEVSVEFTGDFGGEGEPGFNFQYKPHISSNATPEQLKQLINDTDAIAEIHKTLRQGLKVTLIK